LPTEDLKIRIEAIMNGGNVFSNLNKQIKDVESDLAKLSLQGKSTSSEFKKLESTLHGLTQKKIQLRGEINKITSDLKPAHSGFSQLNSTLGSLQSGLANLVKGFIGLAIIKEVSGWFIDFGKESVKAFEKSEIAIAKLKQGLKNTGDEGSFNKLQKQASDLQKITVYSDEEIMHGMAMLTTFKLQSDEISKLTPRVLDLAAAFEKTGQGDLDIQELSVMIGKVASGGDQERDSTLKAMRRRGVIFSNEEEEAIKKAKNVAERVEILTQILDNNNKDFAEAVGDTFAGRIKQMKNAFDDIQEVVGKNIADGFMPFLDVLKDLIPTIGDAIIALFNLGKTFVDDVLSVFGGGGRQTFSDMKDLLEEVINKGVDALTDAFNYLKPAVIDIIKSIKDFYTENQDIIDIVGELIVVLMKVSLFFDKVLFKSIEIIIGIFSTLINHIRSAINFFSDLWSVLKTAVLPQPLVDALEWIYKKFKAIADVIIEAHKWMGKFLGLTETPRDESKDAKKSELGDWTPESEKRKQKDYSPKSDKNKDSKENKLSIDAQDLAELKLYIEQKKELNQLTIKGLNSKKEDFNIAYRLALAEWESDKASKSKWETVKKYSEGLKLINKESEDLFKQSYESLKDNKKTSIEDISKAQDEVIKQLANTTDLATRNALTKIIQDYDKLAEDLGKDDSERYLRFIKNREEAYKNTTKNIYDWENDLIDNQFEKEKKLIDDKYIEEKNNLEKLHRDKLISDEKYNKGLNLLDKKHNKNLNKIENEKNDTLISSFSTLLSNAKSVAEILGMGAHTFVAKMIDGFQQIIQYVQLMKSIIETINIIGSIFKIAGAVVGVPTGGISGGGFASGGYVSGAGTGTSDSILARLSNGEFVSTARATSIYRPILEAMNNSTRVSSLSKIVGYASGGYVNKNNSPIDVEVRVTGFKIKGETIAAEYEIHKSYKRRKTEKLN
jgi:hypothetical protein